MTLVRPLRGSENMKTVTRKTAYTAALVIGCAAAQIASASRVEHSIGGAITSSGRSPTSRGERFDLRLIWQCAFDCHCTKKSRTRRSAAACPDDECDGASHGC